MLGKRRFSRYLISTNRAIDGNIHYFELPLKLFTFGQGGCSFSGMDPALTLVPPKTIRMTFETKSSSGASLRKEIDGDLIYVRPNNITMEMVYGVKFKEDQISEMLPFVTELEDLTKRGIVDRA